VRPRPSLCPERREGPTLALATHNGERGPAVSNAEVADALEHVADLLEAQDANRYRVRAYCNAAEIVRRHPRAMAGLLEEGGTAALGALPGIGRTIAANVAQLVTQGRLAMLERLEGEVAPERLLTTVPGIGPTFAERVHHELGVDSLEDLEQAAWDGRLGAVPGFGPRRVRAVRESLESILGRSVRRRARRRRWLETRAEGHDDAGAGRGAPSAPPRPDVATLLAVDAEYRARAGRGELRRIAPRRFNPEGEAWLPILHVERDGWHLTALYSNTARAHELGRTRDWVVVFYERDGDEGQCTVVTEQRGPRAGRRVVRGREAETPAGPPDPPEQPA